METKSKNSGNAGSGPPPIDPTLVTAGGGASPHTAHGGGNGASGGPDTFTGGGDGPQAGGGGMAEALQAQAAAARTPPTGIAGAVEAIRLTLDEEAHILWTAGGPRRSHIKEFSGVLVNFDGARRIMIVQAFESGAWRLYSELAGKTGPEQLATLAAFQEVEG